MPIDLKNNIALTASTHVENICNWFLKKNNLNYFLYDRTYDNGYRFSLCNRSDWTNHYYQYDYQNVGKFERHSSCYKNCFVLWDQWNQNCDSHLVMKVSTDSFNISHGLTLVKCGTNYFDTFNFATTKDNYSANEFYLSNINLFENFSLYFLDQAKSLIKKADSDLYFVEYDDIDFYSEYSDTLLNAGKLKILDIYNKPILSNRELNCVNLLLQGKTVNELAVLLNISSRTAEKHLIHIKEKLDCKTMFQLGNKISAFGLDKFLSLIQW